MEKRFKCQSVDEPTVYNGPNARNYTLRAARQALCDDDSGGGLSASRANGFLVNASLFTEWLQLGFPSELQLDVHVRVFWCESENLGGKPSRLNLSLPV
jgi:hypothetical protein